MKALQFRKSVPRYALLKLLGGRRPSLSTGVFSLISLRDIAEPKLPNESWVRVAPRLSGICGSDVATVCAKGSPYLAPLISMPFVLGHEVAGTIVECGRGVSGLSEGDRVVLRPALGCTVRGIHPPCKHCRDGYDALCRNVTRGVISAGIQTGYCRDTGGGFGENLVAHPSQMFRIPDEVNDRAAVLIEPFACALHGALNGRINDRAGGESWGRTVLVLGCGSVGLLTIAALRAAGCTARILAVAKHAHQREHARRLGADALLPAGGSIRQRYAAWAEALSSEVAKAEIGKPAVIGGADVVFDCVASSSSIDNALRFTRSGGRMVLVGMPGMPFGIDWTPLWYKELSVRAAYAYGPEMLEGQVGDTFALAVEWMQNLGQKLAPLVGSPLRLDEYRKAFSAAMNTGRSGVVKTIFAVNSD